MRVIAGTAGSLKLKTPEGGETRPTNDRIKETLFNMLQTDIPGSVFVDMFSGAGPIGIEALSRGAERAYFCENAPMAYECLKENIKHTRLEDNAVLLRQDAFTALDLIHEREVDIIFMDPPYEKGYEKKALTELAGKQYVTENTLIIVEASLNTDFSYMEQIGFKIERVKQYKKNQHLFIRKA